MFTPSHSGPSTGTTIADMTPTSEAVLHDLVEVKVAYQSGYMVWPLSRPLLQLCVPNLAQALSHPTLRRAALRGVWWKAFGAFLGWLRTEYEYIIATQAEREQSESITYWLKSCTAGMAWHDDAGDPLIRWSTNKSNLWDTADVAIGLYIFAKMFFIPRLQQDAMDRLVWCNNTAYTLSEPGPFLSSASIQSVYDRTMPADPLRRWLTIASENFFYGGGEDLPERYLLDVAENKALGEQAPGGQYILGGRIDAPCLFHEHETEEELAACTIRVNMERPLDEMEEDEGIQQVRLRM